MNSNVKMLVYAIVSAGAVAISVRDYRRIVRHEREVRRKIDANTAETILTMRLVSERIHDRIKTGYYSGKSFQTILDDFDFECIIEANKEK